MTPHKTKQYLIVVGQLLLLIGIGLYGYQSISTGSASLTRLTGLFGTYSHLESWSLMVLCLLPSLLQWMLEAKKWQLLARPILPLSWHQALRQSLQAQAVALLTPMKIGEYGAKALFFQSAQRKQVLKQTLLGNAIQAFVTFVFGLLGALLLLISSASLPFLSKGLLAGVVLLCVFIYIASKKPFQSSGNHWRILALASVRYLLFSTQFILLLLFFGLQLSFQQLLGSVYLMYLLSSLVPFLQIFDVALRGGTALVLLTTLGAPPESVLLAVFIAWLSNTLVPSLVGGLLKWHIPPRRNTLAYKMATSAWKS
ncbi:hypothetical protein [Croceiramulus getboli]|nr:hypothetical protein P8624_06685 [Flavobacteriaceae bacterium YJPT1-3]